MQKFWSNIVVWRFLRCIWFYTQRKDRVNSSSIWSLQRNCYHFNDALQKYESHSLLTQWWHQLLQHCHWSLARRYIDTISIHILPRLYTSNVNRSDEKNGLTLKMARSKLYPAETITDADYIDYLALLAHSPGHAKSLLHYLEQAARGIGLCELR